MTTRRWLAMALLVIAAVTLLWWSKVEEQHEARTRQERAAEAARSTAPAAPLQGERIVPEMRALRPGEQRSATPGSPPLPASPATPSPSAEITPSTPATTPSLPAGAAADIEQQLDQVNLMLRDYRTLAGGNPVGTNAEIMKAITGENGKGAVLGPPEGQPLNGNGELLDPWGTPYFFHQLSGREMEIRSAGPDARHWTGDDQTMVSGSGASLAPR